MKFEDIYDMTNEEIAEACEDAADLLDGGHWARGSWFIAEEDTNEEVIGYAYCVEGALSAALGLDQIVDMEDSDRFMLLACPVYSAVLETLNHQIHESLVMAGAPVADVPRHWYGEGDLPNWNDHEDRTEQEVVDLLRKTAKRVLTED